MSTGTDHTAMAIARYRTQLNEGREEARHWLELLSNRQLAENIARTRDELTKVQGEDLSEPLSQVLRDLGVQPQRLTSAEMDALRTALAEVHMQVDREDLAYAEQLLARRRAQSVDSIVGEIVERER